MQLRLRPHTAELPESAQAMSRVLSLRDVLLIVLAALMFGIVSLVVTGISHIAPDPTPSVGTCEMCGLPGPGPAVR